jgi:protein-tyrosine phosphatase
VNGVGRVNPSFVDIHCHLLPGLDDGADDECAALGMARIAVAEGIETVVATPHQLGNFATNRGETIREAVVRLQALLDAEQVPLRVLPGADVRIEDGMLAKLKSGEVLTLADGRRHVLLELPHELYFPLEPLLAQLAAAGLAGILSHPERNQGILRRPALVAPLVENGCLMQVTAGSLVGRFGPASQQLAEQLLTEGLVHFLATDAHGTRNRPPLVREAFERAAELAGEQVAHQICCENPRRVAEGKEVAAGRLQTRAQRGLWRTFFSRVKVG